MITTILPLLGAYFADAHPSYFPPKFLAQMDALDGWVIPIGIGISILLAKLAYAPYKFFSEEEDARRKLIRDIEPKFNLSCDNSLPGCVVETKFANGLKINFFRVKVMSDCMMAIPKCSGFITSIKKGTLVKMEHESVQVTFAPGNELDAVAKKIHPKVPAYLDVLAILENNQILICTKNFTIPFSIGGKIFDETGIYILNIVISGKGVSSKSENLIFDWTGDWKTAKLSKA